MPREWKVGDRLANRWEIRKVMKGGMGVVYVVYDHDEQEVLAAKTFQDEALARNPRIAPMFRKEALAWVALEAHPNIAQACFVAEIAGKPVLFVEYVSGGDLSAWVGTPRLMDDTAQVLRFALSFCDGMMHLRAKGIQAHRDIKPQNCLITEDGVLKITDFGLVKVRGEIETEMRENSAAPDSLTVSRTGRATGTATHMAPEQFRDSKHVGVTADIYSFGVTLFQMLTGILPFSAWTWDEWAQAHLYGTPRIEEIRQEWLQAVVARCLEKDPAQRFADFAALRSVLAAFYAFTCGPAPVAAVAIPVESDPEHWLNKGVSLASLGMRERALGCYDRALALDAGQVRVMVRRGDLLQVMGRTEEAVQWYDRALAIDPGLAVAWHSKGAVLGDLALLEKALALAPLLAPGWVSRGIVLEKLGRMEEAAESLHRAVQIHPLLAEGWARFGELHRRNGRLEEAQACLKQAVALHAHLPLVWCSRGEVSLDLRRWEDAAECYHAAVQLDLLCAAAWLGWGKAFARWSGHAAEAVRCLGRCLELDAGNEEAHFYLGLGLEELTRWDEALAAYENAGKGAEVWLRKATVLDRLGDVRGAAAAFGTATEMQPGNQGAWMGRAKLAREMGENAEALGCFERALALNPYLAEALLAKAELCGDAAEALSTYGELVRLHPDLAAGWFGRGAAMEREGSLGAALIDYKYAESLGHPRAAEAVAACQLALQTAETAEALHTKGSDLLEEARAEEALVYLEKALALEPGRRFALAEKAQALRMLGRAEEAVVAYEKAIASDPEFWVLWYRRGELLRTPLRRYREALACFEKAATCGCEQAEDLIAHCRAEMVREVETVRARALGLVQVGKWATALESMDEALAMDAECAAVWTARSLVLAGLGRTEERLAALDQAIALAPEDGHAWFLKAICLGPTADGVVCAERAAALGYPNATELAERLRGAMTGVF